jgi:putative transposon-encoded protein
MKVLYVLMNNNTYIMPKQIVFEPATEIKVTGIIGFLKRKVTAYGTGAKVTCPKEYLGKTVYLVITNEPWQPETEKEPPQGADSKP